MLRTGRYAPTSAALKGVGRCAPIDPRRRVPAFGGPLRRDGSNDPLLGTRYLVENKDKEDIEKSLVEKRER